MRRPTFDPPARLLLALLLPILWLSGCASTVATAPAAPPATAAEVAGTAAGELPSMSGALHWMRNSAEYRADLIQTYRLATVALEALAAGREPGTWAVALDADETVISNSQYAKERQAVGEEFDRESWAEWVARREAPPLPGAIDFLARVHALGGTIAIVTNRDDELCPDTEADFRAFDIPFDVILCRVNKESPKEKRWQSVQEGTSPLGPPGREILLWLGDNIGDFPAQSQDLRLAPPEAYALFGVRYFVVPNPDYGSWERNPKH